MSFSEMFGRDGVVKRTDPGPNRGLELWNLDFFARYFANFTADRSMYYIEPNISRLLTRRFKSSLAEVLGPSRLNWYVSHWWGTPFSDTMSALKRHAHCVSADATKTSHECLPTFDSRRSSNGGFLSYWICTFSNNQWQLDKEMGAKPEESSFFKALQGGFCKGVCMVLDESATPLSRSWCLFEFLQTIRICEAQSDSDAFQGLVFAHSTGVLHYGTASIEVSLKICNHISGIRLENTQASSSVDKDLIDKCVIEQLGSFETCNRLLRDDIKQAVNAANTKAHQRFSMVRRKLEERSQTLPEHRLSMDFRSTEARVDEQDKTYTLSL